MTAGNSDNACGDRLSGAEAGVFFSSVAIAGVVIAGFISECVAWMVLVRASAEPCTLSPAFFFCFDAA